MSPRTHRWARAERVTDIPLVRLDNSDPELFDELMAAVERVSRSGQFILGDEVEAFEGEFAAYCEATEAVGVSSGTDALVLALQALGVGPGHEVVLPANTFIATAEAVTRVAATPVLVDVDPSSHLILPDSVEAAITPRTRAVIAVHLYGRTAELEAIIDAAHRAAVPVIEDACQAHGARYRGRRVGAIADCGCFSFYPAKNLGAWGDGGAVVTNDRSLAEQVRLLRSHGEQVRYIHRIPGTTARLDAIQAAVLRVKLRLLDNWNAARRRLAAELGAALRGTAVEAPAWPPEGRDHVFHQYVVETANRDALREHLTLRGIASAVHYPVPIHLCEAYAALGLDPGSFPVTERLARRICSLPMFPGMTSQEVDRIAAAIAAFVPDLAVLAAAS